MQVEGREPSPDTPKGEASSPPPRLEAPPPQRQLPPTGQSGTSHLKSPLHISGMLAIKCYHHHFFLPQAQSTLIACVHSVATCSSLLGIIMNRLSEQTEITCEMDSKTLSQS